MNARAKALRRTERRILGVAASLALATPLLLHHHVAATIDDSLEPALAELTGQPVTVDDVDVRLSGAVRLHRLAVGTLASVEDVEVAVAPERLLAGHFGADEIRLEHAALSARFDGSGRSDLQTMLRRVGSRLTSASRGGSSDPARRRRIRVTEGALVVDVAGIGRFTAEDVELHPHARGVRLTTSSLRAEGRHGAVRLDAHFGRAAADIDLPRMKVERLIAVAGEVELTAGAEPLRLRELTVSHRADQPSARVVGQVDEGGVARRFRAALAPDAISIESDGVPLAPFGRLAAHGLDLSAARAQGRLTVVRPSGGPLWVDLDGQAAGVVIQHPILAEAPVGVDLITKARLAVAHGAIEVENLSLTVGAIEARVHGHARLGKHTTAELGITLEPADCLAALESVPSVLRGPVVGLALGGRIGGSFQLDLDLARPPGDAVHLDATLTGGCEVTGDAPAADPRQLATTIDHTFPDGHRAAVGSTAPDWVRLDGLPRFVEGAFVAAEDARFFSHHGFDWGQIAKSLEIDLREGRLARGGSTISQQLIKNAFLSQRRSLDRKLQEAILTWRLEQVLDKRTILARYLNVIELGPGVFGIGAAARHWFNESPARLSVRQAAFLAALTPEPRSMSRRLAAAGKLDPVSAERVETILRAMKRQGVIGEAEYQRARAAKLELTVTALATASAGSHAQKQAIAEVPL